MAASPSPSLTRSRSEQDSATDPTQSIHCVPLRQAEPCQYQTMPAQATATTSIRVLPGRCDLPDRRTARQAMIMPIQRDCPFRYCSCLLDPTPMRRDGSGQAASFRYAATCRPKPRSMPMRHIEPLLHVTANRRGPSGPRPTRERMKDEGGRMKTDDCGLQIDCQLPLLCAFVMQSAIKREAR